MSYTSIKDYIAFINTENVLAKDSDQLKTTLLVPNSLHPLEGRRKIEGKIDHGDTVLITDSTQYLCESYVS